MTEHTIRLGDREFRFTGPLKFKQLRVIEPLMLKLKKLREGEMSISDEFYETISEIILSVVSSIDNSFTKDSLANTALTDSDLLKACTEISYAMRMYKPTPKGEVEGQTESPNQPSP